jgi:hypothetical protein
VLPALTLRFLALVQVVNEVDPASWQRLMRESLVLIAQGFA